MTCALVTSTEAISSKVTRCTGEKIATRLDEVNGDVHRSARGDVTRERANSL